MGSLSKEEAEGFFTDLGEKKEEVKEKPKARAESLENLGVVEHISRNMNWNEGVEKIIKQSMLIGNLEGAIDCCLKCGRAVPFFGFCWFFQELPIDLSNRLKH